jgi:hypothetical protein
VIEERARPAIVFGDALSGALLLKEARHTCNDPPQPATRECSETMIAEAACAAVSLNLRSGRVYGACAPNGTIDALPSLRLRKRCRCQLLWRMRCGADHLGKLPELWASEPPEAEVL